MTRPRVLLKIASSLDGRIATAAGESRWISGPEARAEVHRLRAQADAIAIGAATALVDDPELTVRDAPAPPHAPLRVVFDSGFRLPLRSRLVKTLAAAPVLVIGAQTAPAGAEDGLAAAGIGVARVPAARGGIDLGAALQVMATHGVESVLVEAGGRLAASLIGANLVDQLEWVRAPILIGADGKPALGGLDLAKLADAPRFRRLAARAFGDDVWESYERI